MHSNHKALKGDVISKSDVPSMFGSLPFTSACNGIICTRKPL